MALFSITAITSCDNLNPSERLMVGKWYSSDNSEHVTFEVYNEYNEDKTCNSNGTIRYIFDESDGIQEVMTLSFTTKGTWSINDKIITVNTTDVDIKITDLTLQGENLTDDRSVIQEVVASEKKRLYYDLVIPLKKEFMGEYSDRIITLNETTCVTVDKDGERSEYRKLSSK